MVPVGRDLVSAEMRRVLIFQHGADIPVGHLGDVLTGSGFEMEIIALDEGDQIPAGGDWAGVVSLGGVMSAHEEQEHPWLITEKQFLAAAVADGIPTLGICLGAQILADALGGRAYRSDLGPEIGVVTVLLTDEGTDDPVVCGLAGAVPTWHFDTFDAPPGATLLAVSDRFLHAFRYGTAVGIQSHPEATPVIVAGWIAHPAAAAELEGAGVDPALLAAEIEAHAGETAAVARRVFGAWASTL
jgi:GMP synthase (glutamine-hydrolysing)